METPHIKNELHLFIESASNETLQNFLRSLDSRSAEDDHIRTDLNRIMESNSDMRIKLSELMVDYN